MSWKIRHQGSPQSIDDLLPAQIIEGLQDGLWEPTDEVMGPNDAAWQSLESHPQFEEVAAEWEPPIRGEPEDETRLDMNPLIDVCLVLLIFFILTTSYAALQKYLDSPGMSEKSKDGLPTISQEKLKEFAIKVVARMEGGKPVIRIEDQPVAPEDLVGALRPWVKDQRRTSLWLNISDDVPYDIEIKIRDSAKGAGVERVLLQINP